MRQSSAAKLDDLHEKLYGSEGNKVIYRLSKGRHWNTLNITHVFSVRDKGDKILRDPKSVLNRWMEYFGDICTHKFPHPTIPRGAVKLGPVSRITSLAVKRMKAGTLLAQTIYSRIYGSALDMTEFCG